MYLGLDLGDKKCGIAVFVEGIVIPKGVFPRINLIKILKKYFLQYNIKVLVVGLPYDIYGNKNKQLEKTEKFISKLISLFPDIEIKSVDERYTTIEAQNIFDQISNKKNNNDPIDDISASLILENYLNLKNNL